MAKQRLSPKAAAAKKKRDLATAKTPRRTAMKAENQRKRRAATKAGQSVAGKDYDHNTSSFTTVKKNRSATKTTNNTMPGKKKKKAGSPMGIKAAIARKKNPKPAGKGKLNPNSSIGKRMSKIKARQRK